MLNYAQKWFHYIPNVLIRVSCAVVRTVLSMSLTLHDHMVTDGAKISPVLSCST